MTNLTEPASQADLDDAALENATGTTAGALTDTAGGTLTDEATLVTGAAPGTQRKVVLLTEYLTSDHLPKMRLAMYNTVVAVVKRGELPGLIHRSDKGDLEVVSSDGKLVVRQYAHVLLKNTPELPAQLDQLGIAAMNSELVRSHGRSLSVSEMLDMGDALDFDAILGGLPKEAGKVRRPAGQSRRPAGRAAKAKRTRK